jgi:hypothetical protein
MKLYKYMIDERVDVLAGKRIRFSPVSALNDPFEFAPYYDAHASPEQALKTVSDNRNYVAVKGLTKIYKSRPDFQKVYTLDDFIKTAIEKHPDILLELMANTTPQALEEVNANMPDARKRRIELLNKNLGILCLTEEAANLLMWAHYTRDHTGFVIEFDGDHPYFADARRVPTGIGCLGKVDYTTKRPYSYYLADIEAKELYFVKSSEWKYEQEWRMLNLLSTADHVPIPGVHLFDIPPQAISAIILGCRSSEKLACEVSKILKESPELSHVELRKAELQDRDYALDIKPFPVLDCPSTPNRIEGRDKWVLLGVATAIVGATAWFVINHKTS